MFFWLILILIGVSVSCADNSVIVRKNYNFNGVKRIGLAVFADYENFKNSGRIFTDSLLMQLMSVGFEVVLIDNKNDDLSNMEILNKYKCDALLTGTITRFTKDQKVFIFSTSQPIFVTDADVLGIPKANLDITAAVSAIGKLTDSSNRVLWVQKAESKTFLLDTAIMDASGQLSTSLASTISIK